MNERIAARYRKFKFTNSGNTHKEKLRVYISKWQFTTFSGLQQIAD